MNKNISNTEDLIDTRDIIERIEEIEGIEEEERDESDTEELDTLTSLMDELQGMGGDEQWRGEWYPITLIRDDYFEDYAQELAEDVGAIDNDAKWPQTCIDWSKAAAELQQDYSSVEFDGVTYWTR